MHYFPYCGGPENGPSVLTTHEYWSLSQLGMHSLLASSNYP
uniref:Uncharacterized protein n=1 Tax=Arundo donax TaxID=35708 RepID=A0A0A9C9S9_ARUDO